ncbi:MAG: HigA family addiction module antitoxin [Rubrobacteraceae bacterium]
MITDKREVAPLHPGRVLALEFLEPLDLSGYKLARELHTNEQRVYAVLRGERSISDDLAIRLGRCFGVEPEFFVNLQSRYDLEMEKMRIGRQVEDEVKPLASA